MTSHPASKARRIALLEREIERLTERLASLRQQLKAERETSPGHTQTSPKTGPFAHSAPVSQHSSPADKIKLFRELFTGREDAYAIRWTSTRTGKSGWSPAVRGGYYTDETTDADLLQLDDAVIEQHLRGATASGKEFHVGLYPMLADDTCRLLACDFDSGHWRDDARAYTAACEQASIPFATEVSRSGEGAHVWIFFDQKVPAHAARSLGAALLRHAMTLRSGMGLESYDRLFPAQDLLPSQSPGRMRLGTSSPCPCKACAGGAARLYSWIRRPGCRFRISSPSCHRSDT